MDRKNEENTTFIAPYYLVQLEQQYCLYISVYNSYTLKSSNSINLAAIIAAKGKG